MNDNLDGNTAALNAYELEQEKRDRDMEINEDNIRMQIEELVVGKIENNSDVLHEAISGEALLFDSTYHRDIFTEALLEAVKCSSSDAVNGWVSHSADSQLGRVIRVLVTDYIVEAEEAK